MTLSIAHGCRRYFDPIESDTQGSASLAHRYWQKWWADQLRTEGFDVQTEVPRGPDKRDGRFDVFGRRGLQTIAVEIETGKSDVVENAKRGLRVGIDAILLVTVD